MHITWIVAADKERLRVFETADTYNFREVEEIENYLDDSVSRRRNATETERHPRASASAPYSSAVSELLNTAYNEHRYEKLRLLAEPEVLDTIRSSLCKEAQLCIEDEQEKDISWFDAKAIKDYIRHDLHS